jgi:hypothetical protein
MYGLEFVLMGLWRMYCKYITITSLVHLSLRLISKSLDVWQNTRRECIIREMGLSEEESAHQGRINAELDVTDYGNIHFRYST